VELFNVATLGSYGEYDEFLEMLADAQRHKLNLNRHKGFLGDVPPSVLLERLKEEIVELEDAAKRGSAFDMILESADVANFALGFVISALRVKRKEQCLKENSESLVSFPAGLSSAE